MAERITSRANPLCAHFRKLASSRAYRQEAGEFLCDSPKLLREACLWGAPVRTVLHTPGVPLPDLDGADVREVSESVMAAVSPMETPQGVVFTCAMAPPPLPTCLEPGRYLVLDGIQDPGNTGTILRTADAFDCRAVFLLPGCADLYSPKTLRSAMGAHFRSAQWSCTLKDAAALFRAAGVPLYAAALGPDTADVRRMDLTSAALVIGSEGRGVSPRALAACQGTLQIPMSGRCESLNAAVAAAVLLWEGWRQT